MAETAEAVPATETKKIVNPRVEIDTSPPFESVKEAVDRFGGSGPWVPHHLLRLAAAHHDNEAFDVEKMEEQAWKLERDLTKKEQETLNVLKELEATKRFVEGLKLNLMPELSSFESPDLKLDRHATVQMSPGYQFTELNKAKSNLNKTSVDLALIQASLESLNKNLRRDKVMLERRSKMQIQNSERDDQNHDHKLVQDISTLTEELSRGNFEAEQFKNMTEASRYEVMKATAEIERVKNSIKMAEMRLNAAKKMEEAAKAVEAIALAERSKADAFLDDGITLSFEDYRALAQKAKRAEELMWKTKFVDDDAPRRGDGTHSLDEPVLEKFEETAKDNSDILDGSTRLVVEDDVMIGRQVENRTEKQHVSLSEMLRKQSRLILHPNKSTEERSVEKRYFVQRKKFGFIQVPIPTKKKAQPMNTR